MRALGWVVSVMGLLGCGPETSASFDDDGLAVDEAALSAPPVAPAPAPGALSFARTGDERAHGVRIVSEPRSNPVVVYSVRLDALAATEQLLINAEVLVSRCNRKDRAGQSGDAATSPCLALANRPYDYTPRLWAALVLADGPSRADGQRVSPWKDRRCDEATHHCDLPLTATVEPARDAAVRWLNLVVAADSIGERVGAKDAVEVEQRNGFLAVTRLGAPSRPPVARAETSRLRVRGDVGVDQTEDEGDRTQVAHVVLQAQVDGVEPGDVLSADSSFRLTLDSGQCDPLVVTQLFVRRSPGDVGPDTRDAEPLNVKNGHNCADHGRTGCSYEDTGALQLGAGWRGSAFVSVVATAFRSCARPGGRDTWRADGQDAVLRVRLRR